MGRGSRNCGAAGAVVAALALGAALSAPAGALGQAGGAPAAGGSEAIDPSQIPSVHNTLYKVPEGVVSWDVLGDLDVATEVVAPLRAVFTTSFTAAIEALDGGEVKLMGFIYPLEGGVKHERFLLTAWPPSCPFCLPAGPSQMVEVFGAEAIEFTDGAIVVGGRFELLRDDPSGLYYRLHDARLLERHDDIRWNGATN